MCGRARIRVGMRACVSVCVFVFAYVCACARVCKLAKKRVKVEGLVRAEIGQSTG